VAHQRMGEDSTRSGERLCPGSGFSGTVVERPTRRLQIRVNELNVPVYLPYIC
jgi:hypothetical protein